MEHFSEAKYSQVGSSIIEKIESGEYATGQAIPSERELIEKYDVSRITVRKAIDELVAKGFLTKVQGKGTFVKSGKHRQNLFCLTSCKQDIESQGMVATTKILSAKKEEAEQDIRIALGLEENDEVFRLERVYYADGISVNYTITHLPIKLFPGIDQINFSKRSLYELLESKYKVRLIEATRTVEAVLPNTYVAQQLDMPTHMPVLLFKATTKGEINGTVYPIENFTCYYRSDRFKFYIHQINE